MGSIDLHRVPKFRIPTVDLESEFDILQVVGEGWFTKVFLVEHRKTRSELVLKGTPKESTTTEEFLKEFHFSYALGVKAGGKFIVKTFDILFAAEDCYFFAQEFAQFGDLSSNVSDIGIGEIYTKKVGRQLAGALDFLHDQDIVHRDVKLDNVLIFNSDFSKIKLGDFGSACRQGTSVTRFNEWVPQTPPEILDIPQDTPYLVQFHHDTWQFGILLFLCLTGCIPWQKAERRSDPKFETFDLWSKSRIMRAPKSFRILSKKGKRLFRKILEVNPQKRIGKELTNEIEKYLEDKWLTKIPERPAEEEDLATNFSMLSFHSSLTEKNRLLGSLTRFGVETTVDRNLKKDRIKEWIATSTVLEEEEDEEDDGDGEGSTKS